MNEAEKKRGYDAIHDRYWPAMNALDKTKQAIDREWTALWDSLQKELAQYRLDNDY